VHDRLWPRRAIPLAMEASAPVVVQAEPASPRVEHTPTVGFSLLSYLGSFTGTRVTAFSASYHLWTMPGVDLSAGGRFGFGPDVSGVVLDGFVAVALSPAFATHVDEGGRTGAWRPSLGVEVGVSSIKTKYDETFAPEDVQRVSPQPGALYGSLMARPLRFRLTRFMASALGLGVGTTVPKPGEYVRLDIEFVQLGFIL
jgi:hypothetical protein